MLGELRFYRSTHQGKFTTKQRFIALDETFIPEDAAAKRVVDTAAIEEKEARNSSTKLLEDWLAGSRGRVSPQDGGSAKEGLARNFVGSSACGRCHIAQYVKWSASAHAHATDPLPPRAFEFETGCLSCHATGTKSANATSALEFARFQSVQCEECHGPGSNHIAKPGKDYGQIANMQTVCARCHTSETSPSFDLQTAWGKMKH
jgi:hypothetical protein